jgi:hypothetical protein
VLLSLSWEVEVDISSDALSFIIVPYRYLQLHVAQVSRWTGGGGAAFGKLNPWRGPT